MPNGTSFCSRHFVNGNYNLLEADSEVVSNFLQLYEDLAEVSGSKINSNKTTGAWIG